MVAMDGRRSSGGHASLVAARVVLPVLSNLFPKIENVRPLGSPSWPLPHGTRLRQAFASTASAQQPSRPELEKLLSLATELRAVGDTQTAERLEEIAPAQEALGPSSSSSGTGRAASAYQL